MQESQLKKSFRQIIDGQVPNLFRLYLNPFVTQACFCLAHLAAESSSAAKRARDPYQVFLANGHDEALSGALKLARYVQNKRGKSVSTLITGPRDRIAHFGCTRLADGRRIEFIPDVTECFEDVPSDRPVVEADFGITVSFTESSREPASSETTLPTPGASIKIVSASADNLLTGGGRLRPGWSAGNTPDIVIFDESWVHHEVPFAAFVARSSLFRYWRTRAMSMFHSTTFQPNTISSLQFLRCMDRDASRLMNSLKPTLRRIERDRRYRAKLFGSLYSPSLQRLIRVTGFGNSSLTTAGHSIDDGNREIFDCVGGVACSMRGHNPPTYLSEIGAGDSRDLHSRLESELGGLAGFSHCLPAGSGAAAVETGLKIGLVSQPERNHVLALKGGFGGKTLFALTGTDSDRLKTGLDPLYPDVVFVDPYADDSRDALEQALDRYPIGVLQMELVQGVGGVRAIPSSLIEYVKERRQRDGFWLLVDEVQTGMYRTGQFTLSQRMGAEPDILTLGKGTSDMMFPSALTLYSDQVDQRLQSLGTDLVDTLRKRHEYEWGYKTILNTLARCDRERVSDQVLKSEQLFKDLLQRGLADNPIVREVRVFGLLIGIELEPPTRLLWRLGPSPTSLYLLEMLRHKQFPILAGFCQNDRRVLKLTPPLTTSEEEIESICETIIDVLARPLSRLAMSGLRATVASRLSNYRRPTDPSTSMTQAARA